MYRKRKYGSKKYSERAKRAAEVQAEKRLAAPPPFYPPTLPELRRRVIVEDYDFNETVRHEILLYKTNRIDSYRVVVDGQQLERDFGWARVLELVRKAFLRLASPRSQFN